MIFLQSPPVGDIVSVFNLKTIWHNNIYDVDL